MKYYFYRLIIHWLVLFFIFFGLIWHVYKIKEWIYHYCSNSLSYVIVTGNRYFTTNNDIIDAIMPLGKLGTFITQDINVIQKQIEKLQWVEKVSVRKKWPDTLKIHLVEHIPIAYWNDDYLVSVKGIIFKFPNLQSKNRIDKDSLNIPVLYGPDTKVHDVLNHYLIFKKILKVHSLYITSVQMNIYYSWQLVITDGYRLKLGRENVIDRLRCFIEIYPILIQKINENNQYIDYVDLRYRSGFVVKWIQKSINFSTTLYKK